jgi:hypothetical protein
VKQEKDVRAAADEVKKAEKAPGDARKKAVEKLRLALEKCPYLAEGWLLLDAGPARKGGAQGKDKEPEPAAEGAETKKP